jgi:hypothetical protein
MPSHFYIKQNDTRPAITAILTDANDAAVNMRVEPAGSVKVNASSANVTDSEAGQVSYNWTSSNTDTAADYEAEFQVTFAGGAVQTFPGRNWIAVHVIDDIA